MFIFVHGNQINICYWYVMVLAQYEDPHRQEAARKTVPADKLEEKAMVALARVCKNNSNS